MKKKTNSGPPSNFLLKWRRHFRAPLNVNKSACTSLTDRLKEVLKTERMTAEAAAEAAAIASETRWLVPDLSPHARIHHLSFMKLLLGVK